MMKKTILLNMILMGFYYHLQAQTQLLPQVGPTLPFGDFKSTNLHADRGLRYGLHLDQMGKRFGIGLYGALAINKTNYQAPIPNDINTDEFRSRIFVEASELEWKSLQVAIGPILRFPVGKKSSLDIYSKGGVAKMTYPDYRYFASVTQPFEQEFTFFQTLETDQTKEFNLMIVSGLRLNIGLTKNISLSLSGDFTHLRDVVHAYRFLEEDLNPNTNSIEILQTLQEASTITEIRECHLNTVGLNVGINFKFNKKDKTKSTKEERFVDRTPVERTLEPETPVAPSETPYECDRIEYLAPGFNDVVILDKNAKTSFAWEDTNNSIAEKTIQYELVLYTKVESGYEKLSSKLITDHKSTIDLKKVSGIQNNHLFWEINPIRNSNQKDYCPFENKKMKVLVFKNEAEAEEKLPECKSN